MRLLRVEMVFDSQGGARVRVAVEVAQDVQMDFLRDFSHNNIVIINENVVQLLNNLDTAMGGWEPL